VLPGGQVVVVAAAGNFGRLRFALEIFLVAFSFPAPDFFFFLLGMA
jgi:hypothetical protein